MTEYYFRAEYGSTKQIATISDSDGGTTVGVQVSVMSTTASYSFN
jgi:hypothetical protein